MLLASAGERTWLNFTVSYPTKDLRGVKQQHLNGSKLPRRSFILGEGCSSFVDESPLMSTAAGYARDPVGQNCRNDHGMIDLDVRTLTGEEFRLSVERSTHGSEVLKMVLDHLPGRSGAKPVLDHMKHQTSEQGVEEAVRLKLHQTLQKQGLAEAETAILCCTYVPTQLETAWCFLMGLQTSEAEFSLEGVTHLTTLSRVDPLRFPKSLISLTFGGEFNQSLVGVTLPSNLRSLTFGERFNQSLEHVTLPNNLKNLIFGDYFRPEFGTHNLA